MKLQVHLLEARNLKTIDRPLHVYAHLKMGSSKQNSSIATTSSSPSSSSSSSSSSPSAASFSSSSSSSADPVWSQEFTFKVDDLEAELHVSLWNKDRISDVFLGRFAISVSTVFGAHKQRLPLRWYPLQDRSSRRLKGLITGEIRLGFVLSGNNPSLPLTRFLTDVSSHVSTTPDNSYLPRSSSSDSFQSSQSADLTSSPDDTLDSNQHSSPSSLLQQISGWLPARVFPSLLKIESTETDISVQSHVLDDCNQAVCDEVESGMPLFFDDDGKSLSSSCGDMPPPLEGGILVDANYLVSVKTLNKILFGPGSQFLYDLAELQRNTELDEGPWKESQDTLLPKRVVSCVKAATRLIKAVKATEEQVYTRADEKGFIVNVLASTPDAPYGNSFRINLQYCLFAGPDLITGEKTSSLRVSWSLQFISNTIMKSFIENGARQGLQDSYKQFVQVLEKYARTLPDSQRVEHQQEKPDIAGRIPKADFQIAKEYFWDLRICLTILTTVIILVHISISKPSPKSGLEFWRLDLPDTLHEFVTAAILGVQFKYLFEAVRKFSRARTYKGSDHGVKARGNGWLLRVTLVGAENVPTSNEDGGSPDPFVVFTCAGQSRRSSVKLQTSNPRWEEKFEFDATEEAPSIMNVKVFNFEGPFTEAESVGHAEINFLKKSPEDLADLAVYLQGKHARASGAKIHLRVVLVNTKEATSAVDYIQKVEKEVGRKISRQSFMKNASFQRLFALPSEEFLVNDFSCSLKRKILLQGRLFLSPRVLAFYSNIFGHKTRFTLLWEDIEEIKDATPILGAVSTLLNPTILVFTRKGRAMDAHHGAKNVDLKGRLKFQFQSFIRYKPAYRTMIALWKYRTLSPEEQMEMIADIDQGDEGSMTTHGPQVEETDTFVDVDDVKLTEVYATELPLSMSLIIQIYEKENLHERIAENVGWLCYCPTPWESMGTDVQQRRVSFKLSNRISLFGTNVTCIQQKTIKRSGRGVIVDEIWTLHDVPFGDNFQIRVRKEMEDLPSTTAAMRSSCKVSLGIVWQKSTMFQAQISKNIFDRYTKHLKDIIDVSVKQVLDHRNDILDQ